MNNRSKEIWNNMSALHIHQERLAPGKQQILAKYLKNFTLDSTRTDSTGTLNTQGPVKPLKNRREVIKVHA